ncbi:unnamed protein product [Dicrocoelium dendriticum]|nr:unnamed protein product [Dicrocoelium dendriticum]CAH8442822.1 unnamed protein product [Dicrocoelium dendriticum]
MKLTVCFGDSKVVVPCGSGALSIRDLAFSALKRVKHTFPKLDAHDRIVVHSLTSARDGGILDWDDCVCDVLDDRELVVAQYSIVTLTNCTSSWQARTFPHDQLFPHLCAPLIVDPFCERWANALFHGDPKSTEVSGSSESGSDHHPVDLSVTLTSATYPKHHYFNSIQFSSVADESNSSSSLSLNMSANSCGVDHPTNTHVWHLVGSELDSVGKSSILSECSGPTRARNPPVSCVNKATETENIACVNRAAAPFCTIPNEFVPLRYSPPSTEIDALKGRSKEHSPASLRDVPFSGFNSVLSTLGHHSDYVATNWGGEDNVGASHLLWNGSEPSTTSSVTYVHGTKVDWHLPPFPHISRETSSLSSFGDANRPHGSYDIGCFSAAPVPLSLSLPSTVPNEFRTRLGEVGDDLLDVVATEPYCDNLQRPQSAVSPDHALCMHDESAPCTSDTINIKVTDTSLDCSSTVPCTSTSDSSLFSLNNAEPPLSMWMLPRSPESPQHIHTSVSSPDTFSVTSDPPSPLCSTVSNSGSRPLFCSLTVSTIPEEEEEEYSVDYDQSIPASPAHRNHRPTDPCPRTLDGLDGGCGNYEEDYPLLRPDYFISLERPEHSNNVNGLTERFRNTLSLNSNKTVEDNLAEVFKPTQSSTAFSSSPSATKALSCLESSQASDSLLSSSLTSTLDCGIPSHNSDVRTSISHESAKERNLEENTQPENIPMAISRSLCTSGTVIVRLVNTRPGENLGIQIKPVYVHSVKTSTEDLHNPCTTKAKIESGLEVHNVLPNGRVARERCLSVGDHILGINGVSLIGVPFEKGRDLFQAALRQNEFTLEVLPLTARLKKLTEESERNLFSSAKNVLRSNASVGGEVRTGIRQDRPAPPPPPRRSPNTVLTNPTPGVDSSVLSTFPAEAKHCATITSMQPSVPTEEPNIAYSLPPTGFVPIYLQKGTSGLGFSLTSRDLPDTKGRAIYVKNILLDGAARVDGRLRAGDRLIQVGDLDVDALGQARTVAWLRERPTNSVVRLLIWRPGEDNPTSVCKNPCDSTPSTSASRMPIVQLSDTSAAKTNSKPTSTASVLLERIAYWIKSLNNFLILDDC